LKAYKSKYRYERKYFVSNDNLEALRNRLLPFVKPDDFTNKNAGGISEYKVQSIYFDTPNMRFYEEKKDGLEFRNKFRIRSYDTYNEGCLAFLEIKVKSGDRISKVRAPYYFDQSNELLNYGLMDGIVKPMKGFEDAEEAANKYLYHHFGSSLRPMNLVVYEREAYMGLFDKDIRITFDKNVRTALYPKMNELFECERLKYLNNSAFVFEVKYSNTPPNWVFNLVEEFSLKLKAISKYADGIDTHIENRRTRLSPIGFSSLNYIK
jgi:SPX domain protein involved in polyphosphate accumulation